MFFKEKHCFPYIFSYSQLQEGNKHHATKKGPGFLERKGVDCKAVVHIKKNRHNTKMSNMCANHWLIWKECSAIFKICVFIFLFEQSKGQFFFIDNDEELKHQCWQKSMYARPDFFKMLFLSHNLMGAIDRYCIINILCRYIVVLYIYW